MGKWVFEILPIPDALVVMPLAGVEWALYRVWDGQAEEAPRRELVGLFVHLVEAETSAWGLLDREAHEERIGHMIEDGFTFTPEGSAVFAEMLARKPADAPLSEWVKLLSVVTNAFLDGRLVWYWDLDTSAWVPGVIGDGGTQDGYVVFDVDLCHGGPLRWGYEWQFAPISSTEPAAPDLSKVAP